MPSCCLGDECKHAHLDVRPGAHSCMVCGKGVHVFCGEVDESAPDVHRNITCFHCVASRGKTSNKQPDTTEDKTGGQLDMNTTTTTNPSKSPRTKKKQTALGRPTRAAALNNKDDRPSQRPPPQKRRKKTQKKNTTSPLVPAKVVLPNKQKSLRLEFDKGQQDPLVNITVCFDLDDDGYGSSLITTLGDTDQVAESVEVVDHCRYLFGTVVRRSKLAKKGNAKVVAYDVEWEDATLPSACIDLQIVLDAKDLANKVRRRQSHQQKKPPSARVSYNPSEKFGQDLTEALFEVHEEEYGVPIDSSSEEESSIGDDDIQEEQLPNVDLAHDDDAASEEEDMEPTTEETQQTTDNRFVWKAGAQLRTPRYRSNRGPSRVRAEMVRCFDTPLQSFLSFIPLGLFKLITHYSNVYAHQLLEDDVNNKKKHIAGAVWTADITLKEMMVFFGILFEMVLRPTPGQKYTSCWANAGWHPYTANMALRRFQQIRAVLHFSNNREMAGSNDSPDVPFVPRGRR